ncbi:MAG: YqaE/Pmp3 family membrane protein [Magnetovibrio sp.]|nr:YqaE/Pmp3 family membrane protein [Magnetovibrio sp.]
MRILLAIFLPFVLFFTIGRPIAAIICLILQFIFIGGAVFTGGMSLGAAWIPSVWAIVALMKYKSADEG